MIDAVKIDSLRLPSETSAYNTMLICLYKFYPHFAYIYISCINS
jgi:hypothetical protein